MHSGVRTAQPASPRGRTHQGLELRQLTTADALNSGSRSYLSPESNGRHTDRLRGREFRTLVQRT